MLSSDVAIAILHESEVIKVLKFMPALKKLKNNDLRYAEYCKLKSTRWIVRNGYV